MFASDCFKTSCLPARDVDIGTAVGSAKGGREKAKKQQKPPTLAGSGKLYTAFELCFVCLITINQILSPFEPSRSVSAMSVAWQFRHTNRESRAEQDTYTYRTLYRRRNVNGSDYNKGACTSRIWCPAVLVKTRVFFGVLSLALMVNKIDRPNKTPTVRGTCTFAVKFSVLRPFCRFACVYEGHFVLCCKEKKREPLDRAAANLRGHRSAWFPLLSASSFV